MRFFQVCPNAAGRVSFGAGNLSVHLLVRKGVAFYGVRHSTYDGYRLIDLGLGRLAMFTWFG